MIQMQTTELLKDYFEGVLRRADHHAQSVEQVSLTLMGAVLWKATDVIEVREVKKTSVNANKGNILWFRSNGKRYAMIYNHKTGKIELRNRTMRGTTLYEFDNNTPTKRVLEIFKDEI